mgnify:CR=1 FL=1
MRTIDWFAAGHFAAKGGLYALFRNFRAYLLLSGMLWDELSVSHFVEGVARAPPALWKYCR